MTTFKDCVRVFIVTTFFVVLIKALLAVMS